MLLGWGQGHHCHIQCPHTTPSTPPQHPSAPPPIKDTRSHRELKIKRKYWEHGKNLTITIWELTRADQPGVAHLM